MGEALDRKPRERKPDAEITNPHTREVILKALRGTDSLTYEYDGESGRLFVYLVD